MFNGKTHSLAFPREARQHNDGTHSAAAIWGYWARTSEPQYEICRLDVKSSIQCGFG
jgi:hypothetical protein